MSAGEEAGVYPMNGSLQRDEASQFQHVLESRRVTGASSDHCQGDSLWANTDQRTRFAGGIGMVVGRLNTGTAVSGNATDAGGLFNHFNEALIGEFEDVRGGTEGRGLTEDFDIQRIRGDLGCIGDIGFGVSGGEEQDRYEENLF